MSALGHGIDIVEIPRISRMVQNHGDRFLTRIYHGEEIAWAMSGGVLRDERLAARFAAKEAVMKVLGMGWYDGVKWTEIAVLREPGGRPVLALSGRAGARGAELGFRRWAVSLSHTGSLAIASVVATGP